MDNVIDVKGMFSAKQLQASVQRDVDSSKFTVQVEYDIVDNKTYNWTNLDFKLIDNRTGKKSEIPITSICGN